MNRFIEHIHSFPSKGEGMDLLIISCSTSELANYWEEHLNRQKGSLIKKSAVVISVVEDWQDGAGNGFGTLYALKKAKERLGSLQGSIAIYHTAGKGTRLAPLTLAEHNNKPGVELPAILPSDPSKRPLSILEMVILQTAPFAPRMENRIAVFWSDQLFIPSKDLDTPPTSPIELLAKRSMADWSQYGLVSFRGQFFGKVSPSQFHQLGLTHDIGINMGSFSISKELGEELLQFYHFELTHKLGKLDTDSDLWMPASLSKDTFLKLRPLDEKKFDKVRTLLKPSHFSIQDIGENAWWWDFGTLYNYYHNCMKLLGESEESQDLRHLFGHEQGDSLCIQSNLSDCEVKQSILMHVDAHSVVFDHAICIKSQLKMGSVIDSMIYHAECEKEVFSETVRADVTDEKIPFYADLHHNAWDEVLEKNPCSFKEQFAKNSIIPFATIGS